MMTLDQNQWAEGWRPESLAFRYFNVLQMFRIKNQVRIFYPLINV